MHNFFTSYFERTDFERILTNQPNICMKKIEKFNVKFCQITICVIQKTNIVYSR